MESHRRIYTLDSELARMAQADTEALRAEVARLRMLENMREYIDSLNESADLLLEE